MQTRRTELEDEIEQLNVQLKSVTAAKQKESAFAMSLVRQRDEALQEIDVLTTKLDQFREQNRTLVAANQALQKRVKHFSKRLKKATSNAVEDIVNQFLKEKWIIMPAMRLCILELAKHGVPMDHIAGVILAVSDCFGIHLDSAPSSRSC